MGRVREKRDHSRGSILSSKVSDGNVRYVSATARDLGKVSRVLAKLVARMRCCETGNEGARVALSGGMSLAPWAVVLTGGVLAEWIEGRMARDGARKQLGAMRLRIESVGRAVRNGTNAEGFVRRIVAAARLDCSASGERLVSRGKAAKRRGPTGESVVSQLSRAIGAEVMSGNGPKSPRARKVGRPQGATSILSWAARKRLEVMARAHLLSGELHARHGDVDFAVRECRSALRIQELLCNRTGVVKAIDRMGEAANLRGDFDEARRCFRRVLEISTQSGAKSRMFMAWCDLGLLEYSAENWRQGKRYTRLAERHLPGLRCTRAKAIGYARLGLIEMKRCEDARAEMYFRKAIAMNEMLGRAEGIAANLGHLGLIARRNGSYETAREHFIRAMRISQRIFWTIGIATSHGNLGVLSEITGKAEDAQRRYQEAGELYGRLGLTGRRSQVRRWSKRLNMEP